MTYPKAVEVYPLDGKMLDVVFENGDRGLFEVGPYIRGSWYGELADDATFRAVRISGLSVGWPGGQDIAPDCLYANTRFQ